MRRRLVRALARGRRAPVRVRPDAISSTDMDAAAASGQAAPLIQVVGFIMRYQDRWWLSTAVGWLPVPPPVAGMLDEHAERIRHQDAMTAANHAAIRAVIDLARDATRAEASRGSALAWPEAAVRGWAAPAGRCGSGFARSA